MRHSYVESPLGDLLVARDDVGLTALWLPTGRHGDLDRRTGDRDDGAFTDVRAQLGEYFAGERQVFDLSLNAPGSRFQRAVWAELVRIPFGTTTTYGAIAAGLGDPGASRAVGAANGQNPISIIVPCHRVVGANGALTGYGGGLPAKRWLLGHEATRTGLFAG